MSESNSDIKAIAKILVNRYCSITEVERVLNDAGIKTRTSLLHRWRSLKDILKDVTEKFY